MSSIIEKISKRAKAIRKKQPGKAWQACIKQASRELKGSVSTISGVKKKKAPAAKKKKAAAEKKPANFRQTGSSNKKYDEERAARTPGKRKSREGNVYYERRKNRSDRPGQLTGLPQVKVTHRIAHEVAEKFKALDQIQAMRQLLKTAAPSDKAAIRGSITYYLKAARAAKSNITNLKKLL